MLGLRNGCVRLELGFGGQEILEFLAKGIRITGDRDFKGAGRFDPFSKDARSAGRSTEALERIFCLILQIHTDDMQRKNR